MTMNEEQSVGVEATGRVSATSFSIVGSLFSVCKTIEVFVEMATTAAHNSFSPLVFKSLAELSNCQLKSFNATFDS